MAQAILKVHEAPMMTRRPPSEIVVAVGESTNLDCFVVRKVKKISRLMPIYTTV